VLRCSLVEGQGGSVGMVLPVGGGGVWREVSRVFFSGGEWAGEYYLFRR
jgi:hypothetical protein